MLNHQPGGVGIERIFGGERLHQRFSAVIDTADEDEFTSTSDEHGAFEMAHIKKQKRFVCENFGIGEFESVERADRCELQQLGRNPDLGGSGDNLLDLTPQHSANQILGLSRNSGLDRDVGSRGWFVDNRRSVFMKERRDIENKFLTVLV